MKRLLFLLLFLIYIEFSKADMYLNEVMYNPLGEDNNHEFIEIYFTHPENLTSYTIEDRISSDVLNQVQYKDSNYALIVEEGFNYSNLNATIYSIGATIGNGLNNDQDIVILKDNNGSVIDALAYTSNWGASNNGNTFCRLQESPWRECASTPGSINEDILHNFSYISISEFLPDPIGDDDAERPAGEWVEIYNDAEFPIDIHQLVLYDNDDDHELRITSTTADNIVIPSKSYVRVYRNTDSDFSLNDNDDVLRLFTGYPPEESTLIDEVSYHTSEENVSWSKFFTEWFPGILTPGEENIMLFPTNQEYSKLRLTEILPDPTGEDANTLPLGEWIEIYNTGDNTINVEGMFFEDLTEHTLYITEEKVESSTLILPETYLTIYFNGNSMLNNDADEVSLFDPSNNLIDSLSYSSTKEGMSLSKIQDSWIFAQPTPDEENQVQEEPSSLELKVPKNAKFGELLKVKINIMKTNESEETLFLFLEDKKSNLLTKKISFSLSQRYVATDFALPLQIPANCDKELKDEEYIIVLSGLGQKISEKISIKGFTKGSCGETNNLAPSEVEVMDLPNSIAKGSPLTIRVKLQNEEDREKTYELWSYLYKGPKSISGERTENLQEITIPAHSVMYTALENTIKEEVNTGMYQLKLKYKNKEQKTPKEITKQIQVEKGYVPSIPVEQVTTNPILFETAQEKTKEISPYLVLALLVILFAIFIKKKDI